MCEFCPDVDEADEMEWDLPEPAELDPLEHGVKLDAKLDRDSTYEEWTAAGWPGRPWQVDYTEPTAGPHEAEIVALFGHPKFTDYTFHAAVPRDGGDNPIAYGMPLWASAYRI